LIVVDCKQVVFGPVATRESRGSSLLWGYFLSERALIIPELLKFVAMAIDLPFLACNTFYKSELTLANYLS
ncbi:MAG: hypothetical protein WC965_14285, partial [Thiohalomonadaceae bacterium]